MIGGLGVGELSIILCIVVVLFGAGRLAGIGSGLGKGIRNFKKEINPEDEKKKELEDKSKDSEEKASE
ncbi:MAG: twin-arginine translocase TatA/TatE family subunit [Proteobacteria bacterium]|nr:twin-arginine translocase TatA/TatE family subunit [Pseudomonadota bacterium]